MAIDDPSARTRILAGPEASPRSTGRFAAGLPAHLIRQVRPRLRLLALIVFGLTTFNWVVLNLVDGQLADELRQPAQWVPNVSILLSSGAMLAIVAAKRLPISAVIGAALAYEVAVSACIPMSQYWGVFVGLRSDQLSADLVGISLVGLWTIFFTLFVPARPLHALAGLVLSNLAVPVTAAVLIRAGHLTALSPVPFASIFVVPYVSVVVGGYVGSRIIYGLGRAAQRAEDLGSYRLLELIGRGGMGEVWKARHHLLARPAAVKLIQPEAVGGRDAHPEALLDRFEREAQATATLQSPHTVELYDFGISESGALYYAMELLDGLDLESLVTRFGPVPPERVVHILSQVCESLGEAHRRGLVHRDIKPANIVLCELAFEHDFVKVLDFGLVKHATDTGNDPTALATRPDVIAGTPAYLAPELASGSRDVDGRADLYSLGCVAFRLLTGQHVFEAPNAMSVLLAHQSTAPQVPSAVADQPIPPALDALVLACLAKAPDDRPPTAEALADELAKTGLVGRWTQQDAEAWWRTVERVG